MDRSEAERMYRRWQADLAQAEEMVLSWDRKATGYRKLVEGLRDVFPDLGQEPDGESAEGSGTDERPAAPGLPPVVTGSDQPQEDHPQEDHPRGVKAVLTILAENPQVWLTVRDVAQKMEERGWRPDSANPEDAVRAALSRAVKAGEAHTGRRDGRTLVYRIGLGEQVEPGTVVTGRAASWSSRGEDSPNGVGLRPVRDLGEVPGTMR